MPTNEIFLKAHYHFLKLGRGAANTILDTHLSIFITCGTNAKTHLSPSLPDSHQGESGRSRLTDNIIHRENLYKIGRLPQKTVLLLSK